LHIAGKAAVKDRNGTQTVIEMMKHLKSDVVLDIRSQTEIDLPIKDSRINVINTDIKNHSELYFGYDAMVLPRRYAGLCLPMNEALISGLPVFMTDISPNNAVLPPQWLAESTKIDQLMTRTMLDVYEADPASLAKKVDEYLSGDTLKQKELAIEIGESNFSPEQLLPRYEKMLKTLAR
jgi:glycosyltransferase involved in cell wall biosynthesis